MSPVASARAARAALLLAPALLLAACSRPEAPAEPVRAVKVMTVAPSSLQAQVEFAGEVRPRVESRLGFRVAGKITERRAEVGQRVAAGALLAQLDAQDYRLAADAARAQVAAATTQRDLAAADFRRFQALKAQNFISGAELERRESALKAAQAQVLAESTGRRLEPVPEEMARRVSEQASGERLQSELFFEALRRTLR